MSTDLLALGRSLQHWQALYMIALGLTVFCTFLIILFSFHLRNTRYTKWSNYVYFVSALLSVVATLGIITITRSLDATKDREMKTTTQRYNRQIQQLRTSEAQFNRQAKQFGQKAEAARAEAQRAKLKAESATKQNLLLQIKLASLQADQAKQKRTTTHSLAQKAQKPLSLTGKQINTIAEQLKPFGGAEVDIQAVGEVPIMRLASQFQRIFSLANIGFSETDNLGSATAHWKGITVVVHANDDRPPLFGALIGALRSAGIQPSAAWDSSVPAGHVAIRLGPE